MSSWHGGKGSTPRNSDYKKYQSNFDKIFNKGEKCPYCPDQGWYMVGDPYNPEPEQCQWCYENPKSVFNKTENEKRKEPRDETKPL